MTDDRNLREKGRRKTLFGGVIFDSNDKKWDCSIVDLSETGAKVRSQAQLEVGSFVELKINKYNDLRRAEVRWVGGGLIGLKFMMNIKKSAEEVSGFFKIVKDDPVAGE